jgi:YD repeat-containing protein
VVNQFLSLFRNFFSRYARRRRMWTLIWLLLATVSTNLAAQTQTPPGEVRVSVVLNGDGSRTTYETDAANRKSTATTTAPNGKVREKITYDLDENGRYTRGEVVGAKGEFRFIALYKYDTSGHLVEETHLAKDDSVVGRIEFHYDAAGHGTGYSTYDGASRLLGQTTNATPAPAKRK